VKKSIICYLSLNINLLLVELVDFDLIAILYQNLFLLNNLPLIDWTIKSAVEAKAKLEDLEIDIIVSTDSYYLEERAHIYDVKTHKRDLELASDSATLDQVIYDIAVSDEYRNYDYYCLLPPTSPLRTAEQIEGAIQSIAICKAHSLVSVTEEKKSIFSGSESIYLNPLIVRAKNRQEEKPAFIANGAIFIVSRRTLIKTERKFAGSKIIGYVMDAKTSVDIHNLDDFLLAEYYLGRK